MILNENFNNLSKLFVYENENGDRITFNSGGGYLINKPEGIDTISVQLSQAQGINQVGSTVQSTNIQPRAVTINGYVEGDEISEGKERLLSVIRPDLNGKLYCDDYYLSVRPTSTPTIEAKRVGAKFQFSLMAAYPYWCKDETASANLYGIEKKFKFPWKINDYYRYGERVEKQFILISNSGQVPIPYTATFRASGGSVVNPKLTDVMTNKYLQLNKTLVAGERVIVEITHSKVFVTSNVDGECRGALDLGSTFTRLAVGDNAIKPEATTGRNYLQVDIKYSTEKVGVTL